MLKVATTVHSVICDDDRFFIFPWYLFCYMHLMKVVPIANHVGLSCLLPFPSPSW